MPVTDITGPSHSPRPAPPDTASAAPLLTLRQQEVLSLLCEGLPDKLIARQLDLSHHTVRGHVQKLYSLLRVSNRMQAMFAARQCRLIL
jgi:DNA-binding NarL/FixJ family response regulator